MPLKSEEEKIENEMLTDGSIPFGTLDYKVYNLDQSCHHLQTIREPMLGQKILKNFFRLYLDG